MTPASQPLRCLKLSSCAYCPHKRIEFITWHCTFNPLKFGLPVIDDINSIPEWCPLELCCASHNASSDVLDEVLKRIQSQKRFEQYPYFFLGDDLEHMIAEIRQQTKEHP